MRGNRKGQSSPAQAAKWCANLRTKLLIGILEHREPTSRNEIRPYLHNNAYVSVRVCVRVCAVVWNSCHIVCGKVERTLKMPRPFVLRSSLSFEALLLPPLCLAIIRRHAHYNMYHNGKGPYNPCQKFAFLLLLHSTSSLFLLFVSHFVRFAHLSEGSPIFKAALHASRIDYQNIRTICSFHNHILSYTD